MTASGAPREYVAVPGDARRAARGAGDPVAASGIVVRDALVMVKLPERSSLLALPRELLADHDLVALDAEALSRG